MIDVTKTREKSKAPNIQQSAISFAQTSAAIALCKNAITLDTYEDLLGGIVGNFDFPIVVVLAVN